MTRSMTGYGRGQEKIGDWSIIVELKSVNHRYFEFSTRTPRSCNYMEDKLKTLVSKRVSRGKVDLYLQLSTGGGGEESVVVANIGLAKSYLAALTEISQATNLPMDINLASLSRFSDILTLERAEIDEEALWQAVKEVCEKAVDSFVAMRELEGERLKEDILQRLVTIENLVAKIEEQSPQTVENYRNRIYQKLANLLEEKSIEDSRLVTEAAIFADRIAVDEETTRIKSHIKQFRDILASDEPVGRKLDFLTQELNREANTIGSKAQDATAAAIVIELKSEMEKIREQIQNIE